MKRKILVVDDSGLARRLTRRILEELDHEVEEAADGAQALEQYVLHRHDLIILDMVMHGMYGMDVLSKFKELNPQLPVIVVSADIQKSTRDQVKQAGAAAMVNKPVDKREFADVVSSGSCLRGGPHGTDSEPEGRLDRTDQYRLRARGRRACLILTGHRISPQCPRSGHSAHVPKSLKNWRK